MRWLALTAALALLAVIAAITAPDTSSQEPEPVRLEGRTIEEWRAEAKRMERLAHLRRQHLKRYRVVLKRHGNVREAISLAATTYRVSESMLLRKALCETGNTLWPRSFNRSSAASGLFQFLPSTFRSTPYAGHSIWSPYANALAAGWMHRVGRGGEWACR